MQNHQENNVGTIKIVTSTHLKLACSVCVQQQNEQKNDKANNTNKRGNEKIYCGTFHINVGAPSAETKHIRHLSSLLRTLLFMACVRSSGATKNDQICAEMTIRQPNWVYYGQRLSIIEMYLISYLVFYNKTSIGSKAPLDRGSAVNS